MDEAVSVSAFINSILPPYGSVLGEIERESKSEQIPIIPHETAAFLQFLFSIIKPKRILEIGTAVGFSAGLFCKLSEPDGIVTTIDRYDIMISAAKANFIRLGVQDRVTLLEGDAGEILPRLESEGNTVYDFIFLDAAKAQYLNFLPSCLRLLRLGGVLVADDVLQNGNIADNRYNIPRRQRTIHKRMRNFLWEVTHDPNLESAIIPIGDGLVVCTKKA